MVQSLLKQLRLVSAEMEQETCSLRSDPRARLLLCSLRMHLCMELMDTDRGQYRGLLLRDWTEAVEAVGRLSDSPDLTGQVLSQTVELVLLPDPDKRQALLKRLDLKTRLKIRTTAPLSFEVISIALDMAEYCRETDRPETLCEIIKNLILLGERRNAEYPGVQRLLVANAMEYIIDLDRALTAKLCRRQLRYFEDAADEDACCFFWFYGLSVLSQGDSPHAMDLLKRCYDLCMDVEGESSWLGVRAGALYHDSLLKGERSGKAEAYLWDVLKKIDSGFYPDMDENAEPLAAYTRYRLLSLSFDRGELRHHFDDILALLFYCVSAQDTNRNPCLTVRRAENLLSAYHLEVGETLLAAAHAHMALDSIPPNGLPKEPSDILLYTNLLLIYDQLHDEEQIALYTRKLLDMAGEWENDPYLRDRIDGILFRQSDAAEGEEDLEYNRRILAEAFDEIRGSGISPKASIRENTEYAWLVINLCLPLIHSGDTDRKELAKIRFVLDYFRNHPERYLFSGAQKLTYYSLRCRVEDRLRGPKALDWLDLAWQHLDALAPGSAPRVAFCRFAAAIYYRNGEKGRSLEASELLLADAAAAWKKAATYLTDQRVCQVLSTVQEDFRLCYALMRCMLSGEELYQRLLCFKDLPALVGRERGILLRTIPEHEELIRDIHALQDRLADVRMNDSLQGTDTARALREDLETAEAGLSAQFCKEVRFTEITFGDVCGKLTDNTAVLEYFFTQNEASVLEHTGADADLELDVFLTVKADGRIHFHHLTIPEGMDLRQNAMDFSCILQNPDDLSASGRKAVLRAKLYRKLLAPVIPHLEGVTNLYIAPDTVLCDIPFEILYGEDRVMLQDRYRICRLVCGRDLLFHDDRQTSGGGSFVLGDPNYEARRGQCTRSRTRGGSAGLEPVDPLPFSGVEARCVGQQCGGTVYTGDAATKYALRDALPCRIIHLATHGVYDEEPDRDSLYSSHLVFAGYNHWARTRTESSHCGNGILTADEISRMDLRETELVVLSACHSSLGDTSYGSVRGLLSGFSAAGARWVVSHMWEASDFTTPILMNAFYDAMLRRGMAVPEALQYAKNYLKTITIAQLRRNGWLELPRDIPFPEEIREAVEEMRDYPDREMPFQDEYYWGGFTVHKSG